MPDPARPVALDALSGTVDLRASVTDMPKVRMQHSPQLPLAPAAIRAYLAPPGDTHRHLFMRTIFDGSRLLPSGSSLWHYWAFGTYRRNGCYYTPGAFCGMQMVWHVGGPQGFDTTTVPNGSYKYCVEALTIAGVDARRCTVVKIKISISHDGRRAEVRIPAVEASEHEEKGEARWPMAVAVLATGVLRVLLPPQLRLHDARCATGGPVVVLIVGARAASTARRGGCGS